MTLPKASVIIVSRDRPKSLLRTISALRFQRYQNFEVIVVTNEPPDGWLPDDLAENQLKYVPFDLANISEARNIGIGQAASEIVAFLDDDAVPEPPWLARLVSAFENPDVAIAGGYVRGRDGIGFQSKGIETNMLGEERALTVAEAGHVGGLDQGWFPKIQGTNCSFRTSVVRNAGGFDPAFSFFFDETDLCARLTKAGRLTAITPLAEVQHGFEAGRQRNKTRVPRSLTRLGRSKGIYLRKHAAASGINAACKAFQSEQNALLDRFLYWGWIGPGDLKRLRRELEAGLLEGLEHQPQARTPLPATQSDFLAFPFHSMGNGRAISGWRTHFKRLAAEAISLSQKGAETTVFSLTRSNRMHRRYFDPKGFWVQIGGIWGKSLNSDPSFQGFSLEERVKREMKLLKEQRFFS